MVGSGGGRSETFGCTGIESEEGSHQQSTASDEIRIRADDVIETVK